MSNYNQTQQNQRGGRRRQGEQSSSLVSPDELRTIITDPEETETLVKVADRLAKRFASMKDRDKLSTSQIRALFGEVRQIENKWSMEHMRERALRRLILLKPKMAYRARKERGQAVRELVDVLSPAVDLVVQAEVKTAGERGKDTLDGNFQRFVEFFEAILAYHKAYGRDD